MNDQKNQMIHIHTNKFNQVKLEIEGQSRRRLFGWESAISFFQVCQVVALLEISAAMMSWVFKCLPSHLSEVVCPKSCATKA